MAPLLRKLGHRAGRRGRGPGVLPLRIRSLVPLAITVTGALASLYCLSDYLGEMLPYPDAPQELLDRQARNLASIAQWLRASLLLLGLGLLALILQAACLIRRWRRTPPAGPGPA